jgi:hypothetical protein
MWTDFFQTFDPWSTLTPTQGDALYVDRPGAPGRRIVRRIQNAGSASRWVLCGARGCGKSTELARIASQLRRDHQVVQIDISHALPESAGMLAVLVVVGAAVVNQIQEFSGPDEAARATATRETFAKALSGLGMVAAAASKLLGLAQAVLISSQAGQAMGPDAATAGVTIASAGLDVAAREAEKKAVELRTLLDRDKLGGALRPEDRENAAAVGDAVNQAIELLSNLTHRRVVLLVDGVDRQPNAEITFADASLLTRIDTPIVLTAPIALRHTASLTGLPGCAVVKVPNLKVVDRDGKVQTDAIDLLVQMVQRRLERASPAVQQSLRAEQIRPIAHLSSGIPRELIEMIRVAGEEALDNDRTTITEEDLQVGVRARRLRNSEVLRTPDWDVLAQALETGESPGESADTLLFNNLLICYYNDTVWYRPHETLISELMRRKGHKGQS